MKPSNSVVLGDGPLADDATVDRDVLVQMRDGVHIACDVYRPRAPGKYPVLFASSPYIKDSVHLPTSAMYRFRECGNIARWVDWGYVYVHADTRGCGKSEGQYQAFGRTEQLDYCEMIEWCGTREWSNGKVGMVGESYYGIIQWLTAQHNPPHLKCIAPYDATTDVYRHFIYKGGILASGFVNFWYNSNVRHRHFLDYADRPEREDYLATDFLRDIGLHPNFDEYWKERQADLQKIRCPAFAITCWEALNVHLLGTLRGFSHTGGVRKLLVNSGDAQALFHSPKVEAELKSWYDRWLKDATDSRENPPSIEIFVRNGEGYRQEKEWPLQRAKNRLLYLSGSQSEAVESLNDGSLSWAVPTVADSATSYFSPDPQWTYPGAGSQVIGSMGLPHATRRILTFTSPLFEEAMEVTGPITLKLWASSTSVDTNFIVSLIDMPPLSAETLAALKLVDASPPARIVTRGWLKASHRKLDTDRTEVNAPYHSHELAEPLEPDTIYEFEIEIWPTSWVFKAGHRLRLDIVSFDQGHWLGHLRGTDTLYHDMSRPSHLVLPVVAIEAETP